MLAGVLGVGAVALLAGRRLARTGPEPNGRSGADSRTAGHGTRRHAEPVGSTRSCAGNAHGDARPETQVTPAPTQPPTSEPAPPTPAPAPTAALSMEDRLLRADDFLQKRRFRQALDEARAVRREDPSNQEAIVIAQEAEAAIVSRSTSRTPGQLSSPATATWR